MGSVEYVTISEGADVRTAYRAAVEQARRDYGYDPFSGTITASDGHQVVRQSPMAVADARLLAQELLATDGRFTKRGPAGAIPVLGNTRTVRVDVPAVAGGHATTTAAAEAALVGQLRDGEKVASVYGAYEVHDRTRRVMSGNLSVDLEGGEPAHYGWLFFGVAPY